MPKKLPVDADVAVAELMARKLEEPEQLSSDLERIAKAAHELASSRLKWSTIILLVSNSSGIGKRDVEKVLTAATRLNKDYLK